MQAMSNSKPHQAPSVLKTPALPYPVPRLSSMIALEVRCALREEATKHSRDVLISM